MLLLSTHLAGPRRRAACEHRRPSLEPNSRGQQRNGNRTTATVNGTTVNPTYDDQDRLLTYGGTTFTYTANGELRTKTDSTGTTTYTYDAVGSLIAVSLPDGRLVEYVTDGEGRRIGKIVNGVLVKQWLYRDQ